MASNKGQPEQRYGVWLAADRVGTLNQRGDYTWFTFADEYVDRPDRPVLGLIFEQDLHARHASALRLPPWFSNLLPEGPLREWIAQDRQVSADREMELLAQVGHDLPGAVRVLAEDESPEDVDEELLAARGSRSPGDAGAAGFKFSLAGVALKFSMVKREDRLTLPAFGEGGDWIVKLPDPRFPDVPRNEHAMMSLAGAVGIDVPDRQLVHREQLENMPERAWQSTEEFAYAIRRFDRGSDRGLIHIEDLAQVRNFRSDGLQKYKGTFETVAAIVYRVRDVRALQEFSRRLAFNVLISNGDAHLKNWSLIYPDRRIPTLSPCYDVVSTAYYRSDGPEDLGLRFGGSKRFDQVTTGTFERLQKRLGVPDANLPEVVIDTVEQAKASWPEHAHLLASNPDLRRSIDESIERHGMTLTRGAG